MTKGLDITTQKNHPASMTVENFRSVSAGALRGFCDVILVSGMILHRCSIFAKEDRVWASPPSKQVIGRDGTVQRNVDGKVRYEPAVSFVDRTTQERWSGSVIEALRDVEPEALATMAGVVDDDQ
jgi:hypothetical protein